MDRWVIARFQQHAQPLAPIATGVSERIALSEPIEAVVFDIYGTLLISGCGDIGVTAHGEGSAAGQALAAAGVEPDLPGEAVVEQLRATIARRHHAAHERGIPFPEVDIVEVWAETIAQLVEQGRLPSTARSIDPRRVAVEYEVRVNPVWPMPGARECLEACRRSGLLLGIVSNAQFFTPAIFPALFGSTLEQLGIPPARQIYSYRYGRAKPDTYLFEEIKKELTGQAIGADRTIYVGNDMRNDIWAAAESGMRTALFAGDRRSLRMRRDDPRVSGIEPDVTVTDWSRFTAAVVAPT